MRILEIYNKLINEVRYINPNVFSKQHSKESPIKDDEVIRVYHGFTYFDEGLYTVLHGLSGKEIARRIYSYESGNNPKGLFVSIDLPLIQRYFGGGGIIIEFSARVSDLEAPVWAGGGSYFVQGEYTKSFKDNDEREQQRLANREKYAKSSDERISKSDRPELGQTIFDNNEKQALFIGDLNPNMIKYVWYNEVRHKERKTNGPWVRYTRKDFIRMMKSEHKSATNNVNKSLPYSKNNRIFKPAEDFNEELFIKRLKDKYGDDAYDRWLNYELSYSFDTYRLQGYFWPKQMEQAKVFYKNKFPELKIN
jgi:hypothetical protein